MPRMTGLLLNNLAFQGAQGASGPIEYVNDSPTAIVPTLGEELLLNPGFETWTDATTAASWQTDFSIDFAQESEDVHSGSYAARFDRVPERTGSHYIFQSRAAQMPAGKWGRTAVWAKASRTLSSENIFLRRVDHQYKELRSLITTEYQLFDTVARATSGLLFILATVIGSGHSPFSGYYDDASLKELVNIFVAERAGVPVRSWGYNHWHVVAERHAGGYLKLGDGDYIYWYVDRNYNRVYLVKVVAGVTTEVAYASITYSDDKAIWWRSEAANTWLVGYDTPANIDAYGEADWTTNALINVDTVTDAALNLAGHDYEFGAFSTDAGNTPQKHRYSSNFTLPPE